MLVSFEGGCYCSNVRYRISLDHIKDAASSLCHCRNCKKAYGGDFFAAVRVPVNTFQYTSGKAKLHAKDNGSGVMVNREFCDNCGSNIIEYSENVQDTYRYVTIGSLDDPSTFRPEGEIFIKNRLDWVPELPNTYQKYEDD
ncbi:uncharacterized protein L201_003814 [Kwoniella dendrophila CBS 6074]|uniref:CENP-V/GFA domain-containing protein n=1 Tax=Kwoniella dendrophila CBS 6074 TaxID=1295534 RepID=A0AAX4JVP9_9TREE